MEEAFISDLDEYPNLIEQCLLPKQISTNYQTDPIDISTIKTAQPTFQWNNDILEQLRAHRNTKEQLNIGSLGAVNIGFEKDFSINIEHLDIILSAQKYMLKQYALGAEQTENTLISCGQFLTSSFARQNDKQFHLWAAHKRLKQAIHSKILPRDLLETNHNFVFLEALDGLLNNQTIDFVYKTQQEKQSLKLKF